MPVTTRRVGIAWCLCHLVLVGSAYAQPTDARPADAYYEFLLGRSLEGEGEVEAAIEAYRRATTLDPKSAEIRAELSALFARENRPKDAIASAEDALRIDPANGEAHRILGTIYGALADSAAEQGRSATAAREYANRAIDHLEKVENPRFGDGTEATLARQYIGIGEFQKAIALLEETRSSEPGMREIDILLARAYTGANRLDDAVATLREAIDADPTFYRARLTLAELFEAEGKWAEAAEQFTGALAMNPNDPRLQMREATAWLNAGQSDRARDRLRETVKTRPQDPAVLYLLAQAERESGDLTDAEATARRLIEVDRQGFRGPYALAQVFEQRREPGRVIETLAPLVGGKDAAPELTFALLTRIGLAYLDLDQPDKAIVQFEKMRSLDPDEPTADIYLVQAYLSAKRLPRALELARAARTRHPDDLRLVRLEAQAWQDSGEKARGVEIMEHSLETHASNPAAHIGLAAVYADAARYQDAMTVLDQAQKRFPDDLSILFQRGALFDRQKRYDDAERLFRELIEKDPKHASALNYLGYLLAERGERLEESVTLIQRALTMDPFNGSYMDSLGWAYFKLNDLVAAEKNLVKAGEQLPSNSVVQDHVGDLFFKLQRYTEAISAWQRALAGDGDSIERDVIERKIRQAREQADRARRQK